VGPLIRVGAQIEQFRHPQGDERFGPDAQRALDLQYIDARDLAQWTLDAVEAGLRGPYNVVSESGHTTMGELLDTCVQVTGNVAQLHWVTPEAVLAAGVEPWTELPIWLPPGELHDLLHRGDVSKALAAGLRCRPVAETIADTWAWLSSLDREPPQRSDRPAPGLSAEAEAK
jgi:2'-hydroxyisoflavone reductase